MSSEARSGNTPDGWKLAWMLLLASSVLYFFWTNEADNDLWGHLLFGRDILASRTIPRLDTYAYTTIGQPWVNHEWLSQVLMATVYDRAGSAGLLVSKFAITTTTFLLLLAHVRRHTQSPHVRGVIGLLAIAVLARGFGIRPQVFTYFFVALTLLLLDEYGRGRRSVLWLLPGMFLIWVNLHGGFVLGLGIVGLFAGADLLGGDGRSFWPWIAFIASAAVTSLNPYGPRLLFYIWNELSRAHPISEWQPASMEAAQFAFFVMLGLFLATLVFMRDWRRDGWQAALALGVGLLALRHQRHTPVFALCVAAPLAMQVDSAVRWLGQRSGFVLGPASRRLIGAAIVLLAALQFALTGIRGWSSGFHITFNAFEYPVAAVQALRDAGARGNIAVPLDWGEYVLWFLAPQVKVSLDGRFATVFPEGVVEDNFNFFSGAPGWRRLLDQYPTQAVLVPAGWPCPIRTLADWQLAYRDRSAEVYFRSNGGEGLRLKAMPIEPPALRLPLGIFP
jgi:hypothetical protein